MNFGDLDIRRRGAEYWEFLVKAQTRGAKALRS